MQTLYTHSRQMNQTAPSSFYHPNAKLANLPMHSSNAASRQVSVTCSKTSFIGLSKAQIRQDLLRLNLASVEFVHWLAIPDLGLVLSFDHQICVDVLSNCYNTVFDDENHHDDNVDNHYHSRLWS